MPSKHIPNKTYEKVKNEYIKAFIKSKGNIKEVDYLNLLILKGLKEIREDEIEKIKKE